MMKTQVMILGLIVIVAGACKKKDTSPDDNNQAPTPATLIFPNNNTECNTGTNITTTESTVHFEWAAGDNNEDYELVITNLLLGTTSTHATADTRMPVAISRGTPFSWFVISYSPEMEDTAQSATWKFYNAGDGQISYAPFPAEIIAPVFAEVLTGATTVSLIWSGSDVDEDLSHYDVYFGTSETPDLLQANVQPSRVDNVPVSVNTVYYWKVITYDDAGNTSDSGLFQFRVE